MVELSKGVSGTLGAVTFSCLNRAIEYALLHVFVEPSEFQLFLPKIGLFCEAENIPPSLSYKSN